MRPRARTQGARRHLGDKAYGSLPLQFEPNKGQADDRDGCEDCREYYEDKFCSAELLKTARQFVRHGEEDPHFLFEFITLAEGDAAAKPFELFKEVLGDVDVENEHEN